MDYAWLLFRFKGRINRARYLVVELALLTLWVILWLGLPLNLSLNGRPYAGSSPSR
jgi:uncharacterized membrane protein YhaH (DUF805 family)